MKVDLSSFSSVHFDRGAGTIKESAWLVISLVLFQLCPVSLSRLKCAVLRAFGARVGVGVVIKPCVKITFPWKLTLGNHVWLGEECCLHNLGDIVIGDNVCISQRVFLCTGSHDYKRVAFDLIIKPIVVEDGVWFGACSWIGPGVRAGSQAVLTAGSVATRELEASGIYQGNPAVLVRHREITEVGLCIVSV